MFDWKDFYTVAKKLSKEAVSDQALSEAYYRIAISRVYYSVALQTRDMLIDFGFEFQDENTHSMIKQKVKNNFIAKDRDKKRLWRAAKNNLVSLCDKRKQADYNSDNIDDIASQYHYAIDEAKSVLSFLEKVSKDDFNLDF